uniref:Saccharopine dehydrogenase-like C-terminal domain-containing protein n=1 Tax=Amblyomma maculatum TaxID=34609 RepID=G3MTU2_AMBMU
MLTMRSPHTGSLRVMRCRCGYRPSSTQYSFYGRQVVKACVRSGTHHIDISAEPQFMKQMEAEFHDEAREKGVLVLRACGFGSIPAEMCLSFLRQHFQGDLDRVESFLAIKEGPQGIKINFGTWQSIMHWLRNWSELMELMRHLPRRCILFRSEVAGGWCLPFPSSDRYVMNQSDMLRQDLFGVKPVQINTYMRAPGFFTGLGLLLLGTIFGLLSLFSAGRWLLERFPGFFSAGKVKRGDLTREQVLSCSFTMTMCGSGWKQNRSLNSEREVGESKHSVTIRLEGPDPAYVTTATSMVQVALVVLKELDRMSIKGGVLSPGVVLDSTSYVDRVEKRGIRMYVI